MPERVSVSMMPTIRGSSSWEGRRSGLLAMPGGCDGYLVSLREVAECVSATPLAPHQLQSWMRGRFQITPGSAYSRWPSLRRAGLLTGIDGVCVLSDACETWHRSDDPAHLMAHVHHNIRFMGELLALLDSPMTTEELRRAANSHYLMGWQATTQIDNCRGWLQSAGMVEKSKLTGHLMRTDVGTALLVWLEIEPPMG